MAVLKKFNPNTQQWEILQGGVQGLQGPPVALAKGTVTTTAAGTNADFSITGTPPAQVLNMTLPRGAAGGWVDPTLLVATDNLDSLVVSGLYMIQSGTGVLASSNWPLDGFAGYIEVVARSSSYILQRATALQATLGSSPAEANLWYRTKFGSTWSPWRKVPVVGRVDADIVGAGRPDIPASMTAGVAALVMDATSGAKFRSTDGPQGAWEWQKRGATWMCVEGDTGYLDFAPLVVAGWSASSIGKFRRIGSVVYVVLKDVSHATDNTDANSLLFNLPTGFTPISTTTFITSVVKSAYIAGSGVYYPKRTGIGQSASISFAVTSSWPTTLNL